MAKVGDIIYEHPEPVDGYNWRLEIVRLANMYVGWKYSSVGQDNWFDAKVVPVTVLWAASDNYH